jgi:hypothetical protein
MTKLNLSSIDGAFVSYDLATIKNIKHGKAKDFYTKADCENNNIRVTDSIITINFNNGSTSSFGNNWVVTFA